MSRSPQRIRFAGALILFLAWIVALTALAIVSADRPADQSTTRAAQATKR
jgi:hypothetical protein